VREALYLVRDFLEKIAENAEIERERESEEKENEIVVSVFCIRRLKFLFSDFVCFLLQCSNLIL